jgi:hypothetical protein
LVEDSRALPVFEIRKEKGIASLAAKYEADPVEAACGQPSSRDEAREFRDEPPRIAS